MPKHAFALSIKLLQNKKKKLKFDFSIVWQNAVIRFKKNVLQNFL